MTSIQWPLMKDELWRQSGIWLIDRPEGLKNAIVVQNEQHFEERACHESISFSTMTHEDVFLNQWRIHLSDRRCFFQCTKCCI